MKFEEVINRRHSCRQYEQRPVEREKLRACLEAGRLAPSACNSQRWVFIAVDEAAQCAELAACLHDSERGINLFAGQVPAYIAIVSHPPRRLTPIQSQMLATLDHSLLDIGCAAQQICLAATNLGLASVMMGWFDRPQAGQILGVPQEREVLLLIGIGYPKSGEPRRPIRCEPQEVIRWNRYTEREER